MQGRGQAGERCTRALRFWSPAARASSARTLPMRCCPRLSRAGARQSEGAGAWRSRGPSRLTWSREVETIRGDVRNRDDVAARARGCRCGVSLCRGGRRRPEHVRDRVVHRHQQSRHGRAARGAAAPAGRQDRRRLQHEHLRRRPLPRPPTVVSRARDRAASSSSRRGRWDLTDERGEPLEPVPTPESKPPRPSRSTRFRNTTRR